MVGLDIDADIKAAVKLNLKIIVKDVEDVIPQITSLKIADGLVGEIENLVSGLVSEVVAEVSNTLRVVEATVPVGK